MERTTIIDLGGKADDPDVARGVHGMMEDLVRNGAALGWVEPPTRAEISQLLADLAAEAGTRDASIVTAYIQDRLVGFGYWRRYQRPTHRQNADLEKLAVAADAQGIGVGRSILAALIASARNCQIEVLTLDVRADNTAAIALYRESGFDVYGRLAGFVAVHEARYDKVFLAFDLRATSVPMPSDPADGHGRRPGPAPAEVHHGRVTSVPGTG